MATVTHRVTTPDTGNTPNTSGSFSPAVGDLLVVFVTKEASALSSPMVSADLTASVAPTGFTLIAVYGHQSSAAHIGVFVADALTTNTTTRTVTIASGSDAGAGTIISVYSISGMTRVGADAVRQSAGQTDQSAGTPAPAFSSAALTSNPCLGAIYNATNPAGLTEPSGWSESQDTGYTTGQVSGLQTSFRNSGETGTTITWGSSSASAFASIIIELDSSVPTFTASGTPSIGAITASGSAEFDAPVYTASGTPSIAPITASAAGTFTEGASTFTADGAASLAPITASASAEFDPPVYAAAGAVTIAALTASGASKFSHELQWKRVVTRRRYGISGRRSRSRIVTRIKLYPLYLEPSTVETFTATAACTIGALTASGSATFTAPVYTGSGVATIAALTSSGAATFTAPVYIASAAATLPAITAAASGTVTAPTYTSAGAATLPAITASGSAQFASAVFLASGAATLGALTAAASATFTTPVYTGIGSATIAAITASGSATFVAPVYTGTAAVTIGAMLASASAETQLTLTLAADDDDSEADDGTGLIQTDVTFGHREHGYRFTGADELAGATIISAILRVQFHAVGGGAAGSVDITCEDADAAAQFTDGSAYSNFTSRPRTAAVEWDITGSYVLDQVIDSVDISVAVQEVVDRPGFAGTIHVFIDHNAVSMIDMLNHWHREGSVAKAARLIVAYAHIVIDLSPTLFAVLPPNFCHGVLRENRVHLVMPDNKGHLTIPDQR